MVKQSWLLIGVFVCVWAIGACPAGAEIVWTDYADNPLDMPMPDGNRSYMANVIWNPDLQKYQIWYEQGSIALVTYAESTDGIHWTNPVLATGITQDGILVGRGYYLYNKGWEYPYKGYFFGRSDALGDHIRFAQSKDGIAWENNQELDMTDATVEGQSISSPDGHAVMYDPSFPGEPYRLYVKTGAFTSVMQSSDGINWKWLDYATVDEGFHITAIVQISKTDYRIWGFRVYDSPGIQYFRSKDGLQFELIQDPVENVGGGGVAGSWNDNRNYHPSVVYDGNGQFKMWRSGRNEATGNYRMGYAAGIDSDLGTSVETWELY